MRRKEANGVGAAYYSNSAIVHGSIAEILFELIF